MKEVKAERSTFTEYGNRKWSENNKIIMRDRDEKTGVQLRMNAKTTNNDNNSNERRWGKDCYHCIFERMYVCMEEINARNIIFWYSESAGRQWKARIIRPSDTDLGKGGKKIKSRR